ncbi:ABC transporter ATP-binding protein [Pelagibacterium montanilacus]|uniref:ABC transporter ATP-binding protein n=1 Tax=Pelagibacterium montanilacus TaxID=2185280 RepID=UPI0013DF7B55|nr:ABC transporter ATP-binding protein [Pelagibacterium montanilacus]
MKPLLEIADLGVAFRTSSSLIHAVVDVSLTVSAGERVGVIGESGSGKSVMARAIMRLDDPRRTQYATSSRITLDGRQILALPEREVHRLRGDAVSMIFQNPMHSLNPAFTVGQQMDAVLKAHRKLPGRDRRARIVDALGAVDLPAPGDLVDRYPHELSGGQRQRVMVAQAILCEPSLIIADEPTSALDVTAQDTVLDVLERLSRDKAIAVLMITHDMGVVARFCETVNVMYGGRLVETGPVGDIFAAPRHPYTAALLAATPNPAAPARTLHPIPGTQTTRRGSASTACAFIARCPHATTLCKQAPALRQIRANHRVACHYAEELDLKAAG